MPEAGASDRREPRGCLDTPGAGAVLAARSVLVGGWIEARELEGRDEVDVEILVDGHALPRIRTTLHDRPDVRLALGLPEGTRNGFRIAADLGDAAAGPLRLAVHVAVGDRTLLSWERVVELRPRPVSAVDKPLADYDQDGLSTVHNNEFMLDGRFRAAYARGVAATGADYAFHWRVHLALWAAAHASRLPGDFVECGVNAGFVSSAIMHHLDWDRLGRTFWLLDTFRGLDPRQVSPGEVAGGVLERNRTDLERGFYVTDVERVRANFAEWRNVRIVEGSIPGTLPHVLAERIAFLHLDLNCAPPEVAALEHFWDRLPGGAVVLLDDYAYAGFRLQKLAMDELAARLGVAIASLPTGQGLLLRPPHTAGS